MDFSFYICTVIKTSNIMENKLSNSFEELVNTLNKYCLYQKDDEVADDIEVVRAVILEVSKRLKAIDEITKESVDKIRKYEDAVDNQNPFTMALNDYDSILNLVVEMNVLSDLSNNQAITENWGNIFQPKTIDEKLTEFYLELEKEHNDFCYDRQMGTCHVNGVMEIKYDCTPFWDNAEGISIVQYRDSDFLTSYIIPFKKPSSKEFDAFKEFYSVQVQIMINSIYKS